jgi:6,7-dimethyl-8-ribityllumazine synthase
MSQSAPTKPRAKNARRRFVLVASRFNSAYVDGLIRHCTKELRALSAGATVTLVRVPGAFEIPLAVREVAAKKTANAIIALGVILQGKTAHAQFLGQTVTQSLQQISLECGVPVIHAVLSLKNDAQARQRCLEDEMNRGTEAARAAFEMTDVLADLRK